MKRFFSVICLLFALCSCGDKPNLDRSLDSPNDARSSLTEDANGQIKIVIFDVGQGDAALIYSENNEAILIDVGPSGSGKDTIAPFLVKEGITQINNIILTHYHEDHIGGLEGLGIEPTGGYYDRGLPQKDPEAPSYGFYEKISGEKHTVHPGELFELGSAGLEVVAANGGIENGENIDLGEDPDENAASIALLLTYGKFKMFFAADITGGGGETANATVDIETPLAPLIGDIDILRVAHHGSNTSSNDTFLDATTPEAAIISLGNGNDYHHPHQQVIERLISLGVAAYQTEKGWLDFNGPIIKNGDIVISAGNDGSYEIK